MKRRRNNSISGQFSARLIEMLRSPAYCVLSRAAHLVLARIEIEHGDHGGNDNGALPVTFDDFENYGIERHAISPAINEAVALGFIEVTERGHHGMANRRRANRFRLTYRPIPTDRKGDGTHEWRRIATVEQAKAVAKEARRKSDSLVGNSSTDSGETPLKRAKNQGETPPQEQGETPPLSRYRDVPTQQPREARPSKGAVASEAAPIGHSIARPLDRGSLSTVTLRLGRYGEAIIGQLEPDHIQNLVALQERGELREETLVILRREYLKKETAA